VNSAAGRSSAGVASKSRLGHNRAEVGLRPEPVPNWNCAGDAIHGLADFCEVFITNGPYWATGSAIRRPCSIKLRFLCHRFFWGHRRRRAARWRRCAVIRLASSMCRLALKSTGWRVPAAGGRGEIDRGHARGPDRHVRAGCDAPTDQAAWAQWRWPATLACNNGPHRCGLRRRG
jgi:hypothetical protein